MKTLLFIPLAVMVVAGSPAYAGSATGSWSKCGPAASGLWLKTIQTGSIVRFQLEISRGAPAHHSGFIEGEFELKGNKGVFLAEEDAHSCEITFIFSAEHVALNESPDKNHCGFGHGVTASGLLTLDSKAQPSMSGGDERETGFP
jgi:hypothetical protein